MPLGSEGEVGRRLSLDDLDLNAGRDADGEHLRRRRRDRLRRPAAEGVGLQVPGPDRPTPVVVDGTDAHAQLGGDLGAGQPQRR